MTRDAPAPKTATAIPAAGGATFPVPSTSVAVSPAAVMEACAMTGAAIAVTRTTRNGDS